MLPIEDLTEKHDANGKLTHKMCCVCFTMVQVQDLWEDSTGQKWDLCSQECATQAGRR